MRRIVPFLEVALDDPTKNEKLLLQAGLYHYMAAVSLEEKPLLKPFFKLAPAFDKDLGYQLLISAARSNHPLIRMEAVYFLMKINLEVSRDYSEALRWCVILLEQYPNNILYHYYLLQSLSKLHKHEEAKKEFEQIQYLSLSLPGLTNNQRRHFVKESTSLMKKNK